MFKVGGEMDIREMEYFLEVCKHESILKASKTLHITQQALSKCIKKIEKILGVSLFIRGTNSIQLTEDGKFLYEKTLEQIKYHNIFLNELHEKFNKKEVILKLGLVPGSLRSLGADTLIRFAENNKGIKLEIVEEYDKVCEELIKNGELDIAISTKPTNYEGLNYTPLKKEKLFVISHKDLKVKNHKNLTISDLDGVPMALCDKNFNLYTNVHNEFKKLNLVPNLIFNANEIGIMIDLVSKGKAINICAEHVTYNLAHKNIIASELKNSDISWEIGIITKEDLTLNKDLCTLFENLIP